LSLTEDSAQTPSSSEAFVFDHHLPSQEEGKAPLALISQVFPEEDDELSESDEPDEGGNESEAEMFDHSDDHSLASFLSEDNLKNLTNELLEERIKQTKFLIQPQCLILNKKTPVDASEVEDDLLDSPE